MVQRPPFPAVWDNTMISSFKACDRKGYLKFFQMWADPYPSIDLHAGQAFAKGLEVARLSYYLEGLPAQIAVARGWQALIAEYGDFDGSRKPNKSASRMGHALVSYFDEYPLETDIIKPARLGDRPAVEFRFALPLPIKHPETGDPIMYSGRFDMLGEHGSQLYIVDEKTTGSLGEYWAKRYELSSQFTGYTWAAQQFGYDVHGAIIRGIGILSKEIKHAAMPFMRPEFLVEEWYAWMLRKIESSIQSWELLPELGEWNVWEPDYADACGAYGGCEFTPVCGIHPQQRNKLLEVNFVKRPWDPINFDGGAAT